MNIDGQPALGQSDVARMIDRLNRAMAKDEHAVSGYRQPKAALMLETLRAIDALFCSKLLTGETLSDTAAMERGLSSWGCNAALALVMPERMLGGSYAGHRSHPGVQAQADDLLFRCGTLASARRVTGWLKQGLATASLITVETVRNLMQFAYPNEAPSSVVLRWSTRRRLDPSLAVRALGGGIDLSKDILKAMKRAGAPHSELERLASLTKNEWPQVTISDLAVPSEGSESIGKGCEVCLADDVAAEHPQRCFASPRERPSVYEH